MFWTILLATATGMRTLTAITVICWAAYLGILPVEGTWASGMASLTAAIVLTVLALGEYVADTLPQTPSRKAWPLVAARLCVGILVGVAIATVLGQPKAGGVIFGVIGALIGTYGGYRVRMFGARLFGRDLPMALLESCVALAFSVFAVWHIHVQIMIYADRGVELFLR
ncbi:MAG TPA: DUF4126 domain-containing protein [Acidobacteriaceae bacterium]